MGPWIYQLLADAEMEIAVIIDLNPRLTFPYPTTVVQPHRIAQPGNLDAVIYSPITESILGLWSLAGHTDTEMVDFKQLIVNPIWFERLAQLKDHATQCGARLYVLSSYLPILQMSNPTLREKSIASLTTTIQDIAAHYTVLFSNKLRH